MVSKDFQLCQPPLPAFFGILLIMAANLGEEVAAQKVKKAAQAPALVVLDFDLAGKDKGHHGELLADLVTAGIGSAFPVLERKQLQKILAEQELHLKGFISPEQVVRVGKLTGAKLLVAGRATVVEKNWLVTVRVISVATARFRGVSLQAPAEANLDMVAQKISAALLKALPDIVADLTASTK